MSARLRTLAAFLRSPRLLLGGAAVFPVLALAVLNCLEQVDVNAVGVVLPEVRSDLHLTYTGIALVSLPAVLLGPLVVLGGGWLGDRVNRVRFTVLAAAVFGFSSILTGLVRDVASFTLTRTVSSATVYITQSAQGSLLTDLYPPEGRGAAIGIWQGIRPIGLVLGGVLGGVIATTLGWRYVFVLLSIPATLAVLGMVRVREPARGAHDFDAETLRYASADTLGPIQSLKALFNIRSYVRMMAAFAVLGMGVYALVPLVGFFYQSSLGLDAIGRGAITAVQAVAQLLGSVIAGTVLQRMAVRRVTVVNGLLIALVGFGYLALALSPNVEVALAANVVSLFAFGVFSVGLYIQVAATTPANLRSMAFAGSGLFMLLGVVWYPIAAGLADSAGLRVSILASFFWYVLGGLIAATGARFVDRDAARANVVLAAEAEARRRRAAGETVSLLEVRGLDVAYGNVQVLFHVDMTVNQGEIIALLGTNGAGKSTLLRTISGLIRPTEGVVLYQGTDITGLDAELVTARGIIHLPGGRGVFPGLSVRRNLRLATYLYRRDPAYREQSMEYALGFFPRLRERLDQNAGTLSGGEQQMLNVAQALMVQPTLLLIDELSLGLAPRVVEELLSVVERISASGVTIVLVEQSVNIALELSHRAYFMEKGEVRFEGRSADLADRDDLVRSVFLAGAR